MATLRDLVAQVATAYFSTATVSVDDIPRVLGSIAASLRAIEDPARRPASAPEEQAGARGAEVQRSITPDALISFEDGRPYKTLRRHLAARGLTPTQYRAKHNLPDDYPMVAPNTSAARSRLARRIGLGGPRRKHPAPEEQPASSGPAATLRPRTGRPTSRSRRRPGDLLSPL